MVYGGTAQVKFRRHAVVMYDGVRGWEGLSVGWQPEQLWSVDDTGPLDI